MATLRTSFWSNVLRRKTLSANSIRTDLKRCLGLGDLTFLAIGSMVGSGLYVLTGTIAHSVSGPAVIISYLIAAAASGLSAVCYAEFAARIPITGSAYQFTYLSVGELSAFIIGWNVLLENIVSAAAVAKAWSSYIDSAMGFSVKLYLESHAPMVGGGIVPDYPDLIAVAIMIVAVIVILSGAQASSKITAGFVGVNLIVVGLIVGCGLYLGDMKNWTEVEGGFFPFGFSGTVSGAATLIFSYVGYEVIATATEEAINPNRDIPLSVFIGLSVVSLTYVGASASLTLMVPYYNISTSSPFPEAFKLYGWEWTRYLVTVGALAAMISTLMATLYVVPRYFMAMSRDGLLMKCFSTVSKTTQVPYISVIIGGLACMLFALTFELRILVEFISIGQLLACTFVALCVVKLRYEPNTISRYMELNPLIEESEGIEYTRDVDETSNLSNGFVSTEINDNPHINGLNPFQPAATNSPVASTNSLATAENDFNIQEYVVGTIKTEIVDSKYGHLFLWTTNYNAGTIPNWLIIIATFSLAVVSALICFTHEYIDSWWSILFICIFGLVAIVSITLLLVFQQDETINTFKVPGVPFIPFISAFVNIILMMRLQPMTWVRLGIWILVGLVIYFAYGYSHSVERKAAEEDGDAD